MITRDSQAGVYSLEAPAILFGIAIGLTIFAVFKASDQTFQIYSRTKPTVNLYFWILGFSIGSFVLWILQTQLAPQILANRLGLLLIDKRRAKIMKIALLIIVGIMNVLVTCIYLTGYTANTKSFSNLHKIWDPIDKVVDLLIDISLNVVFLRIIQHELIANGLIKYRLLFYYGVVFVTISICMDVLMIVMTTVQEPFLYAMTHPIAYTSKLIIEMTMADLILLIAKTPHQIQDVSEQICTSQ
ncbi:hypothetical protein JMJ77_0003769 [Colletotrichum scovillei]|uniref:Uncharacterized protein n=1 Tax=Colletotrichum scovillei TaxID=1209932 RepID=A0A9P7U6P0_9PEZI|nr:hypothetical protein JMJ77_0003769 [Colletotrichum scovillei]KAG7049016.1 hypothetical protein JMJ78_0013000 [Colletotrichum scovillei]KAG7063759.1 hypothetical protein JMJ76_0006808 [Colletotrichum scovillei]